MKSIKRQVDENREFQQNVKQLSEKGVEISESDTMKKAREAMQKSAETTSKVAEGISFAAGKVGEGVGKVLESAPVKVTVETAAKVGETVSKVAEPILETQAAKTIAKGVETIQKDLASNTSSRYLEYRPKSERDRIRAERLRSMPATARPVLPNPEAGGAVVMVKESKWAESLRKFSESNPLAVGISNLSKKIEETDNPLLERARDVWYRIGSIFDETEEARCIRAIKEVDPSFQKDAFLREATEYIIPEMLEAHLKGDLVTLREWCNEKVYAELSASVAMQKTAGLVSDCKLLDLRNVEIKRMVFLEEQIPIIVFSFATQEILLFRDRKTGEVKLGKEDHIDRAFYAVALTKSQLMDPDAPISPTTGGWKVITWHRGGGF
ncbi:protein translocase subunit [Chytridiales sp. JEL 0842]|nr:protein translocase subunit [Chytridiales sp. JEL 0842]